MTLNRYVPNVLTLTRLCLAVPIAVCLWHSKIGWSLALLLIAAITDLADGALAREFNLRTTVGAWLDPAADKIVITTVLVTLTIRGDVPYWFCAVTIARDLALVTGALTLVARGIPVKIQPLLTGKLATVAQNLALLVSMLKSVWTPGGLAGVLYPLSALFTVISLTAYFKVFTRSLAEPRQTPAV